MGRGRAKAKQTKVARQLKYSDGGTDLDALRRELVSGSPSDAVVPVGGSNGTGSGSDSDDETADGTDETDDEESDDLDARDFG